MNETNHEIVENNKYFTKKVKSTVSIFSKLSVGCQHLLEFVMSLGLILGKGLSFLSSIIPPLRIVIAAFASMWELVSQLLIENTSYSEKFIKIATSLLILTVISVGVAIPALGGIMLLTFVSLEAFHEVFEFGKSLWHRFKLHRASTQDKNNNEVIHSNLDIVEHGIDVFCGLIGITGAALSLVPGLEPIGLGLLIASVAIEVSTKFIGWISHKLFSSYKTKKPKAVKEEMVESTQITEGTTCNQSKKSIVSSSVLAVGLLVAASGTAAQTIDDELRDDFENSEVIMEVTEESRPNQRRSSQVTTNQPQQTVAKQLTPKQVKEAINYVSQATQIKNKQLTPGYDIKQTEVLTDGDKLLLSYDTAPGESIELEISDTDNKPFNYPIVAAVGA